MATSPIVSINLYALGGVTAEGEQTNGLGNLAMEMLTRGTSTSNAQQIAEIARRASAADRDRLRQQ